MIVNTAYDIQAKLLAGESQYTPNYIFVEYMNVKKIGDTIPLTTVTPEDTADYYYSLGADKDYLAIPITLKPYIAEPTGDNKAAIYYSVVTSGFTEGTKGLKFSLDKNSTIYGLGLVTRLADAGTNDILFARTNLATEKQLLKPTSDIYINWKIELQ